MGKPHSHSRHDNRGYNAKGYDVKNDSRGKPCRRAMVEIYQSLVSTADSGGGIQTYNIDRRVPSRRERGLQ